MKDIRFYLEDDDKMTLEIDGKEAGYIEFITAPGNDYIFNFDAFLKDEYRGKGLYKQMLVNVINLTGTGFILSDCRNQNTNPIYEHWTGVELESDTPVCVNIDGEDLEFTNEEGDSF